MQISDDVAGRSASSRTRIDGAQLLEFLADARFLSVDFVYARTGGDMRRPVEAQQDLLDDLVRLALEYGKNPPAIVVDRRDAVAPPVSEPANR